MAGFCCQRAPKPQRRTATGTAAFVDSLTRENPEARPPNHVSAARHDGDRATPVAFAPWAASAATALPLPNPQLQRGGRLPSSSGWEQTRERCGPGAIADVGTAEGFRSIPPATFLPVILYLRSLWLVVGTPTRWGEVDSRYKITRE